MIHDAFELVDTVEKFLNVLPGVTILNLGVHGHQVLGCQGEGAGHVLVWDASELLLDSVLYVLIGMKISLAPTFSLKRHGTLLGITQNNF